MDLRMVKTRNQIKSAFALLREKLLPEKIKVKDICRVAMINKTTFYNHYTDAMALFNDIVDHAIDNVISDFPESNKLFLDPRAYVIGLVRVLDKKSQSLKTIFRGKQEVLCSKLEERLKIKYEPTVSEFCDSVRLSFIIGGFVRVIKDYVFSEIKCNIDNLGELIFSIICASVSDIGDDFDITIDENN